MIPVHCRVKHDPENGKYGDCVRASVAAMLEIEPPEKVPHFFHDNCDGETGHKRLCEYLATQSLAPWISYYPGDVSREDVLTTMKHSNPDVYYMLFGNTGDGDHVVVCLNDKIVHNSAWFGCHLQDPTLSNGYWQIMVFVPLVLVK